MGKKVHTIEVHSEPCKRIYKSTEIWGSGDHYVSKSVLSSTEEGVLWSNITMIVRLQKMRQKSFRDPFSFLFTTIVIFYCKLLWFFR